MYSINPYFGELRSSGLFHYTGDFRQFSRRDHAPASINVLVVFNDANDDELDVAQILIIWYVFDRIFDPSTLLIMQTTVLAGYRTIQYLLARSSANKL